VELEGTNIILATGASPLKPNIPGIHLPGVVTSEELLTGVPTECNRLVVIGGGVIGMEFASVFGNLDCEVTIIEAKDRILPLMDREISQNLTMILKKRGILIHTGSVVKEIAANEDGLSIRFEEKQGEEKVEADLVLLSIGRRPNIDRLLGEGLILETDGGGIVVNERFETNIPGIYAIGDCVSGSIQLAHVASAQATSAVNYILGREPEVKLSIVPACVYLSPEIAWVGLTADEAKKMCKAVKTSKYIMSGNAKSIIERQERSFIKLVFDAETEVLLGAQLMCGRATDLIGELTSAIVGKRTAKELSTVVRPHPSFGEGVGEAVEALFDQAIHVIPKRKPK
jgi:dihydrolipoamide dehydrogenase